jgi:hypothetical protein
MRSNERYYHKTTVQVYADLSRWWAVMYKSLRISSGCADLIRKNLANAFLQSSDGGTSKLVSGMMVTATGQRGSLASLRVSHIVLQLTLPQTLAGFFEPAVH